jgi:hypothetical protein
MSPARASTTSRLQAWETCLLPAFSHPDQANPLFLDHVLLGVGVHIAQTY